MIYRVVLDDLYDLHTSDINCMLLNPSLELEMNSAGSFNFTLPPTHPYWDSIEILKSTIDVYEDDDLIFTGRVANIDKNWNNERVVECEGALAYFNDSIHRQMKWETPLPIASEDPTVHNFLKDILDNHNVFVGDAVNRQIHIGHIYVDPYLVTREVDYDTTLDILTRMCIDTNGGYLMIRKDPETHLLYLDWLKDFTEESGQPASFGVNLLDFNTGLHAADICTGVLARGATVNDQVVTLSNVELVDETTYPDMSVDHYTTHDQDILWHREGMAKFGRVVQVHEFPDAQTDWKNGGQIVANSLFEEAKKWLEEKNTKIESIEVEVAELSWLQEGVPKYKLGQIVEILDDAHMAGERYEVRHLPMYKLSCDLNSGSKKVTLGRPPKKELTQISASNSDSSTLSSGNSSGSSSGGGSGSGEECKVHDVRVDGTSVVSNKVANISLTGKADVSTVNALAATVATKADTSTVNALANVVSGKQNQIEFNTLEAATEILTRLKADGKVYNVPSGGGGGTTVIANPSDPATDDLNTIQIDDTVYNIAGSGGSNEHVYTLYDKKTGVWINGFTVFEKVVEISSESTKFLIESDFGDSKSLISVKGCLQEGQTKYSIPDAQFRITVDNDNGLYGNGVDKNWTNVSGYLVLEYAKYVGDSLLIYSNIPDIEWEVEADKFQTDEDWRDFVVTGGTATQEIIGGQNVVNVPLSATGTYALTDKTIDRTLYAVLSCLSPNTSGDYGGIIGFMLAESSGNEPMFTEQINTDITYRNVYGASYDISTLKSSFIDHVLALSVDATNKIAKFYIDGVLKGQAPYNNYGDLRVGSRANGGNQSNVGIKFIGIVDHLDNDTVIANNSDNLIEHFNLNVTSTNLLHYSNSSDILVSATPDMFTNGDADWDGIVVDSGVTKITDGFDEVINFPTSSLGTYALSAANTDVTIYAYVRVVTPSRVGRVIGVPYAESTNNYPMIMVYNNNIDYDTYDTNFNTGINFTTTYRIVALSLNNTTKKAYFYALDDESKIRQKAFSNSGQNILLTKSLNGGDVTESNFKYVGIVNGYEYPNTVWKNLKTIYNHFNQ